jgi:DNA-damage-inducible protein I
MRIEVSIAKSTALPNGALDALNNELSRRIEQQFPHLKSGNGSVRG